MAHYEMRSTAELAHLINYRRIRIPADIDTSRHARVRRDYIELLQTADRASYFRFMDLPAEMRNLVYTELLTIRQGTTCYPQILRTSKEVYQEAQNLLVVTQTVDIAITKFGVEALDLPCGTYTPSSHDHMSIEGLEWPALLRKSKRIRVTASGLVAMGTACNRDIHRVVRRPLLLPAYTVTENLKQALKVVNNVLYALLTFLYEQGKASSIELVLNPAELIKLDDNVWTRMLYPLYLLQHVSDIRITGIPEDLARASVASADFIGPPQLLLRRYEKSRQMLHSCRDMGSHAAMIDACLENAGSPRAIIVRDKTSHFRMSASQLVSAMPQMPFFVDSSWERDMRRCMLEFTSALRGLSSDVFRRDLEAAREEVSRIFDHFETKLSNMKLDDV